MLRTLSRKARGFLQRPLFLKLWFAPLWLALGAAKSVILLVSFRKLAPLLGDEAGLTAATPVLTPDKERRALEIGRAVRLAAAYTPWDSNCFPQAVVARLLLGLYRVPYALYFGLRRDPEAGEMQAHAWVSAGRVNVTGGPSFGIYTVVGVFVSPLLKAD